MNEKEIEIKNKINFSKKHLLIKSIDIIFMIISIFLVFLRYKGIIRFNPIWIIISIFFVYWLFSFAYLVETTKRKKKERIINTYDEEKDNECICYLFYYVCCRNCCMDWHWLF